MVGWKKIINLGTVVTVSAFLASCSNKSQTATEESSTAVVSSSSSRKQVALVLLFLKKKEEHLSHRLEWVWFCPGTQIMGSIPWSREWKWYTVWWNRYQHCYAKYLQAEQFNISEEEYAKLDVVISHLILTSKEQKHSFQWVWGSKSTIGGYEAYVVNAIAKSGKYLVTWVFRSNDGKNPLCFHLKGMGNFKNNLYRWLKVAGPTAKSE